MLTNSQAEALSKKTSTTQTEVKEEMDPELAIPKSSVPNYQNNGKHSNHVTTKPTSLPKIHKSNKGIIIFLIAFSFILFIAGKAELTSGIVET